MVGDGDDMSIDQLWATGLDGELRTAATRFDVHSHVTIPFTDKGGGRRWSRSKRTVTVSTNDVKRFVALGRIAKPERGAGA